VIFRNTTFQASDPDILTLTIGPKGICVRDRVIANASDHFEGTLDRAMPEYALVG
jgi:hypothetical protein